MSKRAPETSVKRCPFFHDTVAQKADTATLTITKIVTVTKSLTTTPNKNDYPEKDNHYQSPTKKKTTPLSNPNLSLHLLNWEIRKDNVAHQPRKAPSTQKKKIKSKPSLQYRRGRLPSDT